MPQPIQSSTCTVIPQIEIVRESGIELSRGRAGVRLDDSSILSADKQGFSHRCNARRRTDRQNSEILQEFAYLDLDFKLKLNTAEKCLILKFEFCLYLGH